MTDVDTVNTVDKTVDRYLEAYGEPDAARRLALIEEVWAADGRLVDPPLDAAGHQGISEMAATVQGHFPGHRFRRASAVDAHHDMARYMWDLVAPDGTVALSGMDLAQLDSTGRLQRVTGFFGPVPAET